MKHNKLHIVLLFLALLSLPGCVVEVLETAYFRSYITSYVDFPAMDLQLSESGNIALIGSYTVGNIIVNSNSYLYTWTSFDASGTKYDSLCHQHNDLTYNTKREYYDEPKWGIRSACDISSIQVVSNMDFDEHHLAGVPLNDIVRFISSSPKKFIESNYSLHFNWTKDLPESFLKEQEFSTIIGNSSDERAYYFPINELLNQLSCDEMCMLPPEVWGFLVFETEPSLALEHVFTVTVELCDGRRFSKQIAKKFVGQNPIKFKSHDIE